MGKLKFMLCSMLALVSVAATAGVKKDSVYVDDVEYIYTNVDENGKHIRGAYLTNPWYSNWSVALYGGAQTLVSGTNEHNTGIDFGTARITPSFELNISKWLTPVLAVRLGFQGLDLEEKFGPVWVGQNHYVLKSDGAVNYFSETNIHGDVMWNFVNSIWGYRANRFYNFAPYVTAGYMRLSHPDQPLFTKDYCDREFQFGFGLYNTFRITNAFQLVADLRWGNLAGRYHDPSNGGRVNHFVAQAGIAYNMEKWYWARSRGIEKQRDAAIASADAANASADAANASADEARKALDDAMKQNEDLQNKIKDAQDELAKYETLAQNGGLGGALTPEEIEEIRNMSPDQVKRLSPEEFRQRVNGAELIVYYQINLSKLNFSEKHHLDAYVKETLERDPKHIFFLTGSADEGTGTFEINTRLSKERAEGVKNILINEYKVPEDQVIIKATIISSEHEDGGLDRCVLFENR